MKIITKQFSIIIIVFFTVFVLFLTASGFIFHKAKLSFEYARNNAQVNILLLDLLSNVYHNNKAITTHTKTNQFKVSCTHYEQTLNRIQEISQEISKDYPKIYASFYNELSKFLEQSKKILKNQNIKKEDLEKNFELTRPLVSVLESKINSLEARKPFERFQYNQDKAFLVVLLLFVCGFIAQVIFLLLMRKNSKKPLSELHSNINQLFEYFGQSHISSDEEISSISLMIQEHIENIKKAEKSDKNTVEILRNNITNLEAGMLILPQLEGAVHNKELADLIEVYKQSLMILRRKVGSDINNLMNLCNEYALGNYLANLEGEQSELGVELKRIGEYYASIKDK